MNREDSTAVDAIVGMEHIVQEVVHQNEELVHQNDVLMEENKKLVEQNEGLIDQNEKLVNKKPIIQMAGFGINAVRMVWMALTWFKFW